MQQIPNKFQLPDKDTTELRLTPAETQEAMQFIYQTAMQIFQAGWDGYHIIQTDDSALLKLYTLEQYEADWANARNGIYGKFLAGDRCYRIAAQGQNIIVHGCVANILHQQMTDDDRYSNILNYMKSYILPNPDQMTIYDMSEDELCSDDFVSAAANILDDIQDNNVPLNHSIEAAIEQAIEQWRSQRDSI